MAESVRQAICAAGAIKVSGVLTGAPGGNPNSATLRQFAPCTLTVMANSLWTTEQFTCPGCGANYTATREEQHEKRSGNFKCSVCDTEIHAWAGYQDFFNWKIIRTKSPAFGRKR